MRQNCFLALGIMMAFPLANGFAVQPPQPSASETNLLIPGVQQFRKWHLVNAEPYFIPSSLSFLCAAPPPGEMRIRIAAEKKANPHVATYIRVYVNKVGEKAFLNREETRFPVGTVIVKEKLPAPDAKTAELLTVMIKRKPGFDAKNGDWDYFVLSGDAGKRIPSATKHCQECHQRVQKYGYLYRTYFPISNTGAVHKDS